ncbi:probable leucine--tRNA ligase, mitochondrial [Pieris napi]|uniref:probable leucine--tRNA ligase, mitochondrial n=1 Tax=Pieris napi TaxID=78633 RepID=UPI001FBABBEF|nr:probable leucine--tRNA ligase, mitochondrial [Pieris napi]
MLKNYIRLCNTHGFHFKGFVRNRSSLGLWDSNISSEIKLKIESHWSDLVLKNEEKELENNIYILPMFPYPSGNLHMGHVRVYSISDTIARFYKLNGYNVIHPIGWDAFGLPAENAAIERGIPSEVWTKSNIDSMKKQLIDLGYNFDWSKEISTCDPSYYKWTQYIFLKLFENGLAYRSKANVNWDPLDKTVLADEQVDENGCSWRSGAKVEKKILTQWFIKTTQYAQDLYNGLDKNYLENWNDIINLQKHWIGECNGAVVTFQVEVNGEKRPLDIWCSDPYKYLHAQYITVKKNHVILQDLTLVEKENLLCYNPITNKEIKIYVCDSILYPEEKEVYLACPAIDSEDRKISEALNIPLEQAKSINIDYENIKAIEIAKSKKCGGYFVSSKLKDWLISRQRYWGTPIPIIHCSKCGTVPVPYEQLPVKLPQNSSNVKNIFTLSKFNAWVNCRCPKCNGNAHRETDTMDTFVDSSWYYYRFLDSSNENVPFEKKKLIGKLPVHCYIGGKEHAVLHLYYARFMSYFLNSLGWTPSKEPFKKLLVQGMVMGQSYKVRSSGKYIPKENVEKVGKTYIEKGSGEAISVQWEKMSKSKHNGENPMRLLTTYGCDTTRLLVIADVPPGTTRHWSDATLPGVLNWQHRLWITLREFLTHRNNRDLFKISNLQPEKFQEIEGNLRESRNFFIATTTYHFKYTQKLSVGISQLQSLTNTLRNNVPAEVIAKSKEFELALASLIIMLSPVTPHFCSELWAGLMSAPNRIGSETQFSWNAHVLKQKWPIVDSDFPLSFQCKVDGVHRCDLKIPAYELPRLTEQQALEIMSKEQVIAKRLKRGILKTKFELYPDCRAILNIFTKQNISKQTKQLEIQV